MQFSGHRGIYTLHKQDRKIHLCITYVVFLKITKFLWLTLKLHPGYTDFFVEIARIKFIESRGQRAKDQGPKYGTEGREKKYPN